MKFSKSFFFDFCVSKFTPSPIPINKGDLQGDLRRICILFTKSAPSKKHPLPLPTKMAFWGPYWEQCLPFVYKKAILKIVLSPNSHRNGKKLRLSHLTATEKWKPHPLLKNISHLYARKSGFRDHVSNRIYTMFTDPPHL